MPLEDVDCELNIVRELTPLIKVQANHQSILYYPAESKLKLYEDENFLFTYCGDPVCFNEATTNKYFTDEFDTKKFLDSHPGHYYLFYYNKKTKQVLISSSLFGMFPLFYFKNDDYLIVSSRIHLILNFLPQLSEVNKRFLIEQLLFNYALFDLTIIKEIKLCPSDHFISVKDSKVDFIKHTDITKLFVDKPIKWKDSADELTSLFIKRFKDFIVDEKSIISFTGGFDGRTLVACSKYYNKDFSTYSVGSKDNSDVYVPQANATQLGIEYTPYFLDNDQYIKNDFYATGKKLIKLTSCMSNYIYVHFLNSAKKLSNEFNYLYTGYFGSELFRALHLAGAMNSAELVKFFSERDEEKWISYIKNSPKLRFINKELFNNELEEIIEDLRKYKANNQKNFSTLNKFFYKYVLEEIFRKVFGPHIFSQSNYINVHTPFLDIQFITELFKSELAGVNNDFFTHNPLKRMKGQLLYGKIISKTFPELAMIKTQKGYSPKDLLTTKGKLKILIPYLQKKIQRKVEKPNLDNLSIISGLKFNWHNLRKEISLNNFYNINELDEFAEKLDNAPEYQRDILAFVASSSIFINSTNG